MKFELNKNQIKKLDRWKKAIKEIYGECGNFEYRFTPNGIGYGVRVWSDLTQNELDITDIDDW